jgi:hypothetical protein
MAISDYYTETIILLNATTSTEGYMSTGAGKPTYSTGVSIKAAVNLLDGNEILAYDKIGFDARYKAYCDVTTEVYEGRRARWSGDTFEIVALPKNTLQKNHHLRILLRDVDNA